MGALLALPGFAQQKNDGAEENSDARESAKTAAGSNAVNVAPAHNFFALPDAPRATPFPGPAASAALDEEPGRLVPRYELAMVYEYINFMPGDPFDHFNEHGATGSFAVNANRWLGLTVEVGGTTFRRNLFPLTGNNTSVEGVQNTFLAGPRLNLRKFDRFVPFAEFLVGAAHADVETNGIGGQYSFALAAGGGVDIVLWKNIAWRFAQFDYLMTNFSGPALGPDARQNNFRAASGLVVRWGFPNPPPPPNQNPVAACAANPASVYAGSGDSVAIHVTASDPDNDNLTYS